MSLQSLCATPRKVSTKGRMVMLLTVATLLITGCNTTQEFRPTASVMVGAHTSL